MFFRDALTGLRRTSREPVAGTVRRQAPERHRSGAGQQITVESLSHSRGAWIRTRPSGRLAALA